MVSLACTFNGEYQTKMFIEYISKDYALNKLITIIALRKTCLLAWSLICNSLNIFIINLSSIDTSMYFIAPSKFVFKRFNRYSITEILLRFTACITTYSHTCHYYNQSIKQNNHLFYIIIFYIENIIVNQYYLTIIKYEYIAHVLDIC